MGKAEAGAARSEMAALGNGALEAVWERAADGAQRGWALFRAPGGEARAPIAPELARQLIALARGELDGNPDAPQEIERKFKADPSGWAERFGREFSIEQAYLTPDAKNPLRVRVRRDAATGKEEGFLTAKAPGRGIARVEVEGSIGPGEARAFMALCEGRVVAKSRREIEHGGKTWELDRFEGRHEGLHCVEIELASEGEAFEKPSWALEEVSEDPRYSNAALALGGLPEPEARRAPRP